MVDASALLSYYRDAFATDGFLDDAPAWDAPHWEVPLEEVRSGGLSSHTTREILLSYSRLHPDVGFGERGVPMACCVRTLSMANGTTLPCLLLRTVLDANGTLFAPTSDAAWIPASLVATDEYHNGAIAVCDIDAYRAHERALAALPHDGSWQTALQRALDLFEAVNTLGEEELTKAGASLEDATCRLFVWERPNEHDALAEVLKAARDAQEEGEAAGPVRRLLAEEAQGEREQVPPEEGLPDDVLLPYKLRCGILDGLEELSQKDHDALSAFARQGTGDVLAVGAPKGTSHATLALAAMANLTTESALRGDKAPTMACVATAEQIALMLDLMASRPTYGQVALPTRWIPRVSVTHEQDPTTPTQRRVLGPLPALGMVHVAGDAAGVRSAAGLVQPFAHPKGGDAAVYGDAWYQPKATIYFLDCASGFLRYRVHSTDEARRRLAELLRRIDQERCELIDAYDEVCKASELLRRRDNLVARIGRLRRGHALCRTRLKFWEQVARENPPRKPLFSKAEPDQSALIARNAQCREELAQGKVLVEDVCRAYRDEIVRIESSIDRLRGASANLTRRSRGAEAAGERCTKIVGRLVELCRLTPEQTTRLEAALDGRAHDVSLDLLDKALDQTVRAAEFWISVHIYESRWIDKGMRLVPQAKDEAHELRGALGAWGCLCPFTFVSADCATGILAELADAENRIDLLVCADSHRLLAAQGIALASLANRMLLTGTRATLGPHAVRGAAYDELETRHAAPEGLWGDLREQGLCLCARRSLFDVAHDGGGVVLAALCDTPHAYGELTDLRGDLVPDEPLHTLREPANCADDNAAALRDIIPALSYVLVPDSAWEQRGPSRQNRSEALALGRWLKNHVAEIAGRYGAHEGAPVVLTSPFAAQTALLAEVRDEVCAKGDVALEVVGAGELGLRRWPVVVLCATCGPETFLETASPGIGTVLDMAAAAADDALVLVCGGAWTRSNDEVASAVLKRMHRVGRLFSVPRKRKAQPRLEPERKVKASEIAESEPQLEPRKEAGLVLKAKPLAITALLRRLEERGDIAKAPSAAQVNRALKDVGLIERVPAETGRGGWRPTAAGREVGIVATKDHENNSFCAYTPTAEAVVASVVETMG